MHIDVKQESKLVEVWLTNAEQQDRQLLEQLKPLYKEYKDKGFLVAVFHSGHHDLTDTTSNLLCYNRKQIAQLEVAKTRQAMQV